jgi:uncharacterized protein (TIGR03083 family)
MQTTSSFLDRVLPAIDRAAERYADLVTAAPDPTVRVPASPDWDVHDVTAHLVTVVSRYANGPAGTVTWAETPPDLPAINQDQVDGEGDATMAELVAELRRRLAALAEQMLGYGDEVPSYRFHGGQLVRADDALGILLGELLVHGHDVGAALGRPWPIPAGDVALVVEGAHPILPGWVRPDRVRGFSARFEVRLRGQATHVWSFRDGRLEVDPAESGRVDAHVSADPAAFLLVLYRRESQWRQIAAGRLLAWGRKPWLALTLAERFHKP